MIRVELGLALVLNSFDLIHCIFLNNLAYLRQFLTIKVPFRIVVIHPVA